MGKVRDYSMVQKMLSAALAVLMCSLLAVPALAADTKVKISNSSMVMQVGETRHLKVRFTPADAAETVTWSTSDAEVATVSNDGVVTAEGSGTASIYAETDIATVRCTVTVRKRGEEVKVRSVEMYISSMTVRVDQTRMLAVMIEPNDATDKDVTWSSSNTNVATVDGDGVVTGIAPGTATITAETYNGYTATCAITVPGTAVKGLAKDAVSTQQPDSGEVLTSSTVKELVESTAASTAKGTTGTATFKDKSSAAPAVLNAAAYAATSTGRNIQLKFTTTGSDGKTQNWLILDPQKAKNRKEDLKLGVYTDSAKAVSVQGKFKKFFNNSVAVVQCAQAGSFGMEVQLAAKVELSGMNQDNLRFYTYDTAANRYDPLEVASYTVDKNDYLRFSTSTGGVIIVSNGALVKK